MSNAIQFIEQCVINFEKRFLRMNEEEKQENEMIAFEFHN